MRFQPHVSVIVHTKNSARTIVDHLKSIKNQTYALVEIIMVDNHSTDKTIFLARPFVKQIYTAGPERSHQRNIGVGKSTGAYIYIPDSDMIVSPTVIADCVSLVLKKPSIKAVVVPERTRAKGFWGSIKVFERDMYIGDKDIEAARFFDRKVFLEFGGYDESLTGPEDWDLPQRIAQKYDIGRISADIIHDEGNITLMGLARKKFYYGNQLAKYLAKHPIKKTASQVIYFLRPAFYRNLTKLLQNPLKAIALIIMLTVEQFAGLLGFLKGYKTA